MFVKQPVVIPVYGREDVFATVALLRAQSYANTLRFVIVNNGNKAELSARLKALEGADCHVISFSGNRGGSAASSRDRYRRISPKSCRIRTAA